jgi:hypothetical protein
MRSGADGDARTLALPPRACWMIRRISPLVMIVWLIAITWLSFRSILVWGVSGDEAGLGVVGPDMGVAAIIAVLMLATLLMLAPRNPPVEARLGAPITHRVYVRGLGWHQRWQLMVLSPLIGIGCILAIASVFVGLGLAPASEFNLFGLVLAILLGWFFGCAALAAVRLPLLGVEITPESLTVHGFFRSRRIPRGEVGRASVRRLRGLLVVLLRFWGDPALVVRTIEGRRIVLASTANDREAIVRAIAIINTWASTGTIPSEVGSG